MPPVLFCLNKISIYYFILEPIFITIIELKLLKGDPSFCRIIYEEGRCFPVGRKTKIKKIKKEEKVALAELELLYEEFNEIKEAIKHLKKHDKHFDCFQSLPEEKQEELYSRRKDRKYASIIVELYAIVEEFYQKVYSIVYDEEGYKKQTEQDAITDICEQLEHKISLHHNTETLTHLRNYMIQKEFSFKSARTAYEEELEAFRKNKDAIKYLFEQAREAIKIK